MKDLKIFKSALAYATVGFIALNIGDLIDIAGNNAKTVVETNNDDETSNTIDFAVEAKEVDVSEKKEEGYEEIPEAIVMPTSTPKPTATPVVIEKYPKNSYGYTVKALNLRKGPSKNKKKISKLNAFQTVKLIEKEGNWILVKNEDKKGYIYNKNLEELTDEFVDVDISNQQLKIYDEEGKKSLETSIVSGTETNEEKRTDRGAFEVFYKGTNRYLKGPGYKSYVKYFAAYNGGEGMHDASWRSRFGGNIYKYSGSHGCINLAPSVAPKVFEKVKIGTKVIVHD